MKILLVAMIALQPMITKVDGIASGGNVGLHTTAKPQGVVSTTSTCFTYLCFQRDIEAATESVL